MTESGTESKLCASCLRDDENNLAEAWCKDCTELVCGNCIRFHKGLTPPHKVVPTVEFLRLKTSLLKLSKHCDIHSDQEIVVFCSQHDQLLCDYCVSESHHNCKHVTIKMATEGEQMDKSLTDSEARVDNLTEIMGNVIRTYSTDISMLGEHKKNIKEEVADIRRKIISHLDKPDIRGKIIPHLDKLEEEFNIELESKFNERNEQLTKTHSDIRQRSDIMTALKENMISLKNDTPDNDLFYAFKYLDSKTRKEEWEFQKFKSGITIRKLVFKPLGEISNVNDVLSSFGTLSLEHTLEFPHKQFTLVSSFETTRIGHNYAVSCSCFGPDNKLFLSNYFGKSVSFCDHDGSNSKTFDVPYFPEKVSLYDTTTALVSAEQKGIQLFDLQTLQPGKFMKIGNDCLGATSSNGKIWMRSDGCALIEININGDVQGTISTSLDPRDICPTKDGDMFCTYRNSDDVYVVTPDGEERVIYSSDELVGAHGITVDDHGDVYIAGYDSNNIHRISSDGKQSEIILAEKDGINKPSRLSFNHQTKQLMIVNSGWYSILIYKVSCK